MNIHKQIKDLDVRNYVVYETAGISHSLFYKVLSGERRLTNNTKTKLKKAIKTLQQ